jgi:hypothetical protein
MASHSLPFAQPDITPAEARSLAYRAYKRARAGAALAPVVVDRIWADTLLAVADQPAITASEMMRRTQHLFVLIEDRANWPR